MRFLEAEIDLDILSENLQKIKEFLKKKTIKIIAVVKADAYGHGAEKVCQEIQNKVDYLAVAFCEEAAVLRQAGINSKILVLFDREVNEVFKYNLTPVVFSLDQAKALSLQAVRESKILSIHIKVETGMGRVGIYRNLLETIKEIAALPNLKVEGVMSHLSHTEDKEWTYEQINKLKEIKEKLNRLGIHPLFHISASSGIIYEDALFDAVSHGIMLYGYSFNCPVSVNPCMQVKTKILDIRRLPRGSSISYGRTFITKRDSLIGVIPIGYADGYFRTLSNKAYVIVRDKKVPVVGRICMDLTMIDLTDLPEAKVDEEVILLGSSGSEKITAEDIADWAGTIPYEILTSLGGKAKKRYIKGGKHVS
ncbi:MAG: alanine racemase [Thermodesulfovibrionaceae bacterium]